MTTAAITRWPSLTNTSGSVVQTDWQSLFDDFCRGAEFSGDLDHPGWSAAVFDPPRRGLENVRRVTAVVLDYDGGETIEAATELWGEYYGLIHTTRKHTPAAPRFRVILPLSRPVSPYEYAGLWRRVYARAGGRLDEAPKDPSRFWFVPGSNGEFRTVRLDGAFMDPDVILATPEPAQRAAPVIPIRSQGTADRWSAIDRARAYIERMPEAISGSGGHTATWNVARKLADFGLSESEILGVLVNDYNPRCQPPWSQRELEHKAADAYNKREHRPIEDREREPLRRAPPDAPEPDVERDAIQNEPPSPVPEVRVITVRELLSDAMDRALSRESTGACTTGVHGIDQKTGGMRPGHVWLLGADTSWGKTSCAVMLADVNMARGKRVLIVSAEDAASMYGDRLMARRARVNATRLRDRQLLPREVVAVTDVAAKALPDPVFLDCIGETAEATARKIDMAMREHKIDMVIVDYLQELRSGKRTQDRRNEVSNVASLIRTTIKRANKTGIILSQITVEAAKKYPDKHSIRESRDVSNGAEVILLGFSPREPIMSGTGECIAEAGQKCILIDKAKDGVTGAVAMKWDAESACFDEIAAPPHVSDAYMDGFEDGSRR